MLKFKNLQKVLSLKRILNFKFVDKVFQSLYFCAWIQILSCILVSFLYTLLLSWDLIWFDVKL